MPSYQATRGEVRGSNIDEDDPEVQEQLLRQYSRPGREEEMGED